MLEDNSVILFLIRQFHLFGFFQKMLKYDPAKRMSAKGILNDPYFKNVTLVKATQLEEVVRKKEEYLKRNRNN